MSYYGDIRLGDTIDIKFTTRQISGAPFTLAGTPSVAAYPANSTTEVTAGITLSVDFDLRTGLNNVRVVASGGNGYLTATNYELVITAGTVNSVSVVGECVGCFSIENRSAVMPTTAARTLDVSAGGEAGVDWANVGSPTTALNLSGTSTKAVEPTVAGRTLDVSAGGEAGVDWANVGSPTTALDLSGTTIKTTQVVASVTGAVGSVTGLTAATVHSDLDDIQARLPAALTSDGNMKSDALRVNGSALAAARMQRAGASMVLGTCAALGSTTSVIASSLAPTSAVNDQFNGRIIIFADDTTTTALRGQATDITDYVHATLTFTVTALTTAPANGDTFVIV